MAINETYDAAQRAAVWEGVIELITEGPLKTTRQFPRMARPLSPREKADPWVVALGEVKRFTVVAQEGDAPNKIPAVSKVLEILCIRLDEMLARTAGRP